MERLMAGWDPIPGETPIDISHLKVKGVRDRAQLNALEAENIRKVVVKYLGKRPTRRSAPFSPSWMLRLHKQMFCEVWKWAGRTRKEDLNLGIKWYLVHQGLETLAGDLAYWEQHGMTIMERAVRLHHGAVKIHPFQEWKWPMGADAREYLAEIERLLGDRMARAGNG
jgi:fido (protein-threonine AMPylation protein)